jgi:hypothetical protein
MTLITITYDTTGLNIIAVVDQNPGEAFFCGHPVIGFKDLLTLDFDFIAVSEADDYDKARAMFIEIGFEESKDFFLV